MEIQNVLYLIVWAALFFVMMRFGCGAHIMGHSHRHGGTHSDDRRDARGMSGGSTSPAADPVCGMTVAPANAKSAVYEGRAFYFCSQKCREKFEANPSVYVKPREAAAQR